MRIRLYDENKCEQFFPNVKILLLFKSKQRFTFCSSSFLNFHRLFVSQTTCSPWSQSRLHYYHVNLCSIVSPLFTISEPFDSIKESNCKCKSNIAANEDVSL